MPEYVVILATIMMFVTLVPEGYFVCHLIFVCHPLKHETAVEFTLIVIWMISIVVKLILFDAYHSGFLIGNPYHPWVCLLMFGLA